MSFSFYILISVPVFRVFLLLNKMSLLFVLFKDTYAECLSVALGHLGCGHLSLGHSLFAGWVHTRDVRATSRFSELLLRGV